MSFVIQTANGWVLSRGCPFYDPTWTSDQAEAVVFSTEDEAISASAMAGGTVRKWADVFDGPATAAVFCINCGEFLGDQGSVPLSLQEPFEGKVSGDRVSACRWCADALIEDGVAK